MKTFDFADTGGLFDHVEVNREPFWPRIAWLVAGSAGWHLVLIACIVLIPPVRDARGFINYALPDGTKFVGAVGLRNALLSQSDQVVTTVTEKLMTQYRALTKVSGEPIYD